MNATRKAQKGPGRTNSALSQRSEGRCRAQWSRSTRTCVDPVAFGPDLRTVDDSTTQVSWVFEGKPVSLMAKLMSPMAAMMKGTMRKMMSGDITDLKAFVETSA